MSKESKGQPEVTRDGFIDAWTTSESVEEVSEKTGIPTTTCSARASLYREQGYHMKFFRPGRKPEASVEETNRRIESLGGPPANVPLVRPVPKKPGKRKPELSPADPVAKATEQKKRNLALITQMLKKR